VLAKTGRLEESSENDPVVGEDALTRRLERPAEDMEVRSVYQLVTILGRPQY